MRDWIWFSTEFVLAIHEEQVDQHGGLAGIRDAGLLESALAKPRQLAAYDQPDVADLAAAYAFGIVRNHPFLDGNKRTAFVLAETFLLMHDHELPADDEACYLATMQLAAGDLTQEQFAAWLRANSRRR